MPVDLYVGGAEHAVLHLLYSRFWHKVLYDRGHVSTPEPFRRLVNQGMILVEEHHLAPEVFEANRAVIERMGLQILRFKEEDKESCVLRNPPPAPGKFAPLTDQQVEKNKGKMFLKGTTIELNVRADKMSKSRGNVVNPDDIVEEYGADSLRLYEMFLGPLEKAKPWAMGGVDGVYRFLARVWRLFIDDEADGMKLNTAIQDAEPDRDTLRMLHRTIQKVTEDLEGMRFNTAIAAMMEYTNHLTPQKVRPRAALEPLVLLLSPFAPHLAEELWSALGHEKTLAYEPWPAFDPALTKEDEIEVPVQINGKVRAKVMVPPDINEAGLRSRVLEDARVQEQLAGKTLRREVFQVKSGKLVVSLVVS
jgi:leucyl-tRNA synthetase